MDLFWAAFLAIAYFAPSLADDMLNKNLRGYVFFVNLMLGWTVVIWVYCFIWVYNEKKRNMQKNAEI